MDIKDKPSFKELIGPPEPDAVKDPGYDAWVVEQVRLAIAEGDTNPNSYIPQEEIWKKHGFTD